MSKLLNELGVDSDLELLKIFPYEYESLTCTKDKLTYEDNEEVTFIGILLEYTFTKTRIGSIIRMTFQDKHNNKTFKCIAFNQPFIVKLLKSNGQQDDDFENEEVCNNLSSQKNNKSSNEQTKKEFFIKAKYRDSKKDFLLITILSSTNIYLKSGFRPIYHLPKTVSNSRFVSKLSQVLENKQEQILDTLPNILIEKNKLLTNYEVYSYIHFPPENDINHIKLKKAITQIRYEKALSYCLNVEVNKRLLLDKKRNAVLKINKDNFIPFIDKLKSISIELTNSQKAAINDIFRDLNSANFMFRLLLGDVGTGKTLVAFAAAYLNKLRHGQTLLMAPTITLAMQHYQQAKIVFDKLNMNVALLETSAKQSMKKQLVEQLQNGDIDLLIGTNNLLSENIEFKQLQLAIIDEEQRFGVNQRTNILNKSENLDILIMSATPIPRTISRIVNGDMSESRLIDFPFKQRNIKTFLVNSNSKMIFESIKQAISNNEQIFIILPRIDTISNQKLTVVDVFSKMEEKFPGQCQMLTGRIKVQDREKILENFKNKAKKILISTSIVEVGIDIKEASLMIVYESNYFGLSSLHQFRGRIGRKGQDGRFILVYDGDDSKVIEKLNVLVNYSDGEKVSEFDLQFRGSGSISGVEQSGDSKDGICDFLKSPTVCQKAKEDSSLLLDLYDKDNEVRNFVDLVYKQIKDNKILL